MDLRGKSTLAELSLSDVCFAGSAGPSSLPMMRLWEPGTSFGLGVGLGHEWEGMTSNISWVLPAPPPSSTPPLMLESSCQGLRTAVLVRSWRSFFRTSFGKRPVVSPCPSQINSVSLKSQISAYIHYEWHKRSFLLPPLPLKKSI